MKEPNMSKKEINQIIYFNELANKEITQEKAANELKLTIRQVRNKLKRFISFGPCGLMNRSRGKPSNRKWKEEEKEKAMQLLENEFYGFGPTFAAEKLKDYCGIIISAETLRKSMIERGLWTSRKTKKVHRKRRPRKDSLGQMIQLDGSPHNWFENRAPECTLLVFIDDSTSRLQHLFFAESESFESIMKAFLEYVTIHGIPLSVYVDHGSTFSVNTLNLNHHKKTQFERTMMELGVRVIHANSPQAKGRVERANKSLQDRLVKEMRLANISSIDQANEFVKNRFIKQYNYKFSVEPSIKIDMHKSIDNYDLDTIFCKKLERVVKNDFTVSYENRVFQLRKQQDIYIAPKKIIYVCHHLDGKITLILNNIKLNFFEIHPITFKPINYSKNKDLFLSKNKNLSILKDHNYSEKTITNGGLFM